MPLSPKPSPNAIAAVQKRVRAATGPGFRWMGGYGTSKVVRDPIYRQLYERIAPGAQVLDLGSGIGLLGLVLHERDEGHAVHGIEWDARKVAFAQRLLPVPGRCTVRQGDILKDPWPEADTILLVDVLHYFPVAVQDALLHRIAEHLPPGGTFYLREMDRDAGGRAWMTRLLEQTAVALHWNQANRVHWRSLGEIQARLVQLGLVPQEAQAGSKVLDGNRLITAIKPGA